MKAKLSGELKRKIFTAQANEITEYHIYSRLAKSVKDRKNSRVLAAIASDEMSHYEFWKTHTGIEAKPHRFRILKFILIARILGLTFGIKLMEKGEESAQINYKQIARVIPGARKIAADEDRHEKKLIGLLEEERLKYVGSIVLGLNDALVELTGTLAGLSFALQKTDLIAMAGLITGIAAAFSMAASDYLSTKSEDGQEDTALKSSIYTGIAYIITVIILIMPYLIFSHYLVCLAFTLVHAILIILAFNYYISVAKDLPFRKRFLEMCAISMSVAAFSFFMGMVIKKAMGVEA